MVQHFVSLAPAFLVAAFFLILALNWPRHRTWTRALTCGLVLLVALRYLVWRFTQTVLPMTPDDGFAYAWVWFLFVVELMAFADIASSSSP